MPLIPASLASNLESVFRAKYPSAGVSAKKMALSITTYFDTATAPGQGIVSTVGGKGLLASELELVFQSQYPVAGIAAKKAGSAINVCLSTAIISGGLYNSGPITGLQVSEIINGLENIWSNQYPDGGIPAAKMAKTITTFAKSGICQGIGFPPATPPQIGSLT